MANKIEDINELTDLLLQAKVENENKVTFKGRGLKLNGKEDAIEVIDAIENCKDLQVLELVGNTLGVEVAQLIAEVLEKKPELQRCLWADMFTGRLRSEIPNSLRFLGNGIMEANANLVELDLSDNAFGADCVKALVDLLKSPPAFSLQDLKFNNNGLGGGGIILAETLIQCHARSVEAGKPLRLKTFVAGRNRLENPGATALAKAFRTIGTLEEIHLPQNGINHEGIAALADAVKYNKNLQHLNLNDNIFTEKGAVKMAEGIENIDSLRIINFGDCLVKTEGAKAIAKALESSNTNIEQLILSFNEIELEGGLRLCEGLTKKEYLKSLDLNGNKFGEDGVEELTDRAKEFFSPDALGSLSEDEGCSDSESEEDSQDESLDEDVNEVVNGSPEANKNHQIHNQVESVLTAQNFFNCVTPLNIINMTSEHRTQLLQEVAELVTNADATARALANISGLLHEDCLESIFPNTVPAVENLRKAVFQCVDVLLRDAFDKYPNTPMIVINAILVEMGLVKSEDKKFEAVDDLRGLTVIMGHVCQQSFFPKFIKSVIRSIVAKDNKVWTRSSAILRSQLLQILYA